MFIWKVIVINILIYVYENNGFVLLYDTEGQNLVQYFDCIYSTKEPEIPYCRQNEPSEPSIRKKQDNCLHRGRKWLFGDLFQDGITPNEVLKWSSTIEMADNYAGAYYGQSSYTNTTFLCNCTMPGTFGKYCQYKLTHNSKMFEESMIIQFATKKNHPVHLQIFGSNVLYGRMLCDSGLMDLDWRHICDGAQQCIDGLDEENCDLLEFNECEENEYRCINGMCIDEEFWLDGDKDCMDWSDETDYFLSSQMCPFLFNNMDCDEHLCLNYQWSCGDGQCISRPYRFPFSPVGIGSGCHNLQEVRHMCENSDAAPMWTEYPINPSPDDRLFGNCWETLQYEEKNYNSLTQNENCVYLIRCALTNGLGKSCLCGRTGQITCEELMKNLCGNALYPYPPPKSIDVHITTYYMGTHDWRERMPDIFVLNGSTKCRGYHAVLSKPYVEKFGRFTPIAFSYGVDNIICQLPNVDREFNSTRQFDEFCWKNSSRTFNNQPYAFTDFCGEKLRCFSKYRIADGYFDCYGVNTNDEETFTYIQMPKHRFRCSEQQKTALPIISMGNLEVTCSNQYDEYFYGSRVSLNEIQCNNREDVACTILKEYIRNSSLANFSTYATFHQQIESQMPFHRYCDSFWHQNNQFDENSKNCQNWICNDDEYQCQTGQCIRLSWVCDGEWDCNDATDEQALISIKNWTLHNQMLGELKNRSVICYDRYIIQPFSDICNTTFEFPCLLNNVDNPLDIDKYRPCINLTQLGDGIENCHNAYDERNTFVDKEKQQMIGMKLLCRKKWFRHEMSCQGLLNECENDPLCFYVSKNKSWCSGPSDVVCLNGNCARNARCNKKFECSHGEDEYWCLLYYQQNYYRTEKALSISQRSLNLQQFPPSIFTSRMITLSESVTQTLDNFASNHISSFICNRGIAVYDNRNTQICFCSPAYYGVLCYSHSDRISIIVHLDLTTFSQREIPIFYMKSNLLFRNTIIDHHEFHVVSAFELETYVKHRFYLTYYIAENNLDQKKNVISIDQILLIIIHILYISMSMHFSMI